RALLNLEQTMTRLESTATNKLNLREQLRAQLALSGDLELVAFLDHAGNRPLKDVFAEIHAKYASAESELNKSLGTEGQNKEAAFESFLLTRYGGADGRSGISVENAAHLNRMAVDLLRRQGLLGTTKEVGEPRGRLRQLGLTVHAGEQLLNRDPFSL